MLRARWHITVARRSLHRRRRKEEGKEEKKRILEFLALLSPTLSRLKDATDNDIEDDDDDGNDEDDDADDG